MCDEPLCEHCSIEGLCPSCVRTRGQQARRRRHVARRALANGAWIGGLAALPFALHFFYVTPGHNLARASDAHLQLRNLQTAVALHALDHGDCPEVLGVLATRGYVADSEPIVDPWGRPVDYRCRPVEGGRAVTLASRGADGYTNTSDDVRVEQRVSW